ncbi:hypothetical protein BLS_001581 [Venturia inaequalis]|uniref:N-acetyltransferase domain-containing protein n=1 Tax=Venturia inaequalis TaxID=5025 RepID=A0A8H3ZBC6_VENIN|nr:hypothetical protein EG328_004406 [Venturia inaequalis]KAE9977173.1 hypothetical protein BLS_001581 [Venturia inaequalis]KAE9992739.1 hypothetical protein EG327_007962 [Venturia inaequalis]RDI78048.1 hypothetical protein Vi05172_g11993 [Venturia inaequalis]
MDKSLATASLSIMHEQQAKPTLSESIAGPVMSVPGTPLASTQAVTSSNEQVRVIHINEYKAAALSLAEAFRYDHTTEYFCETPDTAHWTKQEKWDLHLSMMEYLTYAHCLKGLVMTIGEGYGGVALWMPPGQDMDDLITTFRSGMWRLNYKLSPEAKIRFFTEFLPLLGSTKTSVLGPARDLDSWYLVYIGCIPSARGKGYARKLIDHVTAIADAEGKPCYLESSAAVNMIIYGKMGFEVRRKVYLQRAEEHIELDIMVREPKVVQEKRDSFMEKQEDLRK